MSNLLIDLADRKGKPCINCGHIHPIQNRCNYELLLTRIAGLTAANQLIPQLMEANKAAVETAAQFRAMVQQSNRANELFFETLAEYPNGKEIETKFMEKMEAWVATFNQGTSPQKLDTVNSTSKETEDKSSIGETPIGDISQLDS